VSYFLALPIGHDFSPVVDSAQAFFVTSQYKPYIRFWHDPCHWHLTLRFFNDLSSEELAKLGQHLNTLSYDMAPFVLAFQEVAGLPRDRAHSLVTYVDCVVTLTHLHQRIADFCLAIGLEKDARPFLPHITLAKLKVSDITWQLNHLDPLLIEANELLLYKSVPKVSGVEYRIIKRFVLQANS
jgi:RNA 2',3'-cyclic 3'-phosphodiesterase